MPAFIESRTMTEMFHEIWTKMIHETEFGPKLIENGISLYFVVKDPEVEMFVDENGPVFGKSAQQKRPVITFKMDGDKLHQFWLDNLNVPKALALRRIRAKGPVNKFFKVLPLLDLGKKMYPAYCKKYGLMSG